MGDRHDQRVRAIRLIDEAVGESVQDEASCTEDVRRPRFRMVLDKGDTAFNLKPERLFDGDALREIELACLAALVYGLGRISTRRRVIPASEDHLAGFVPRDGFDGPRLDVLDSASNLVRPGCLDLSRRLGGGVEALDQRLDQVRARVLGKSERLFEYALGGWAHGGSLASCAARIAELMFGRVRVLNTYLHPGFRPFSTNLGLSDNQELKYGQAPFLKAESRVRDHPPLIQASCDPPRRSRNPRAVSRVASSSRSVPPSRPAIRHTGVFRRDRIDFRWSTGVK